MTSMTAPLTVTQWPAEVGYLQLHQCDHSLLMHKGGMYLPAGCLPSQLPDSGYCPAAFQHCCPAPCIVSVITPCILALHLASCCHTWHHVATPCLVLLYLAFWYCTLRHVVIACLTLLQPATSPAASMPLWNKTLTKQTHTLLLLTHTHTNPAPVAMLR